LIKRKLNDGAYTTARQVDEAVELMLENARVFNEDGPVVVQANEFGAWWKGQRAKME
jgi:transcription initiation factor TFIID subunit 2